MFSIPFTPTSQKFNKVMKIRGIEDLNCVIYEISEQQGYQLPQNPLDNGSFIADTIYKLPKKLSVRVLVKDEDILTFISSIEAVQLSNNLFTVVSVANEVFKNLKILDYAKDVTSSVVGKQFYSIQMEETKLVQALVETYKSSGRGGYSNNQGTGSKTAEPQKQKKTALKGFTS